VASGVVALLATVADLPELLAHVLEIPPQMPGRQHESRDEQAPLGVAGQRPAMNAELLSRLRSRQQSRISHVSTLGEISTSIIYL
jgi:hypothetical protein